MKTFIEFNTIFFWCNFYNLKPVYFDIKIVHNNNKKDTCIIFGH